MKFFDTHSHPQAPQYDSDRHEVIRRALDAGVSLICVGWDLESSHAAIALAESYDQVWASVGLHPNDNLDEVYDQSKYADLITHPKAVAVGEIGLDYYRTVDGEKKKTQRERFIKQLVLSDMSGDEKIKSAKPLIIHCRDAHDDMISILKEHKIKRGVIHSFTGTLSEAKQYLELGFHLGFNGIVTFAKQYDQIVEQTPVDKILLETDAPYLAPAQYRGQRNEPAHVRLVAERIAQLKNMDLETLAGVTFKNAQRLFFNTIY